MTDEYELLPHEELEALRREVEHIKQSPFPDSKDNETLLSSMKALTISINKLIKIFEGAQEDLIQEYSESSPTKILREISEQNAKIAEGIVALAKIVKGENPTSIPSTPTSIPPPSGNLPELQLPADTPSLNEMENEFDKMDAEDKKEHRKGLFESFKK
ncbi:hypothetical protein ACFLTH_04265 [Bacteroidota bacterium]